jgi:hypothetical protein
MMVLLLARIRMARGAFGTRGAATLVSLVFELGQHRVDTFFERRQVEFEHGPHRLRIDAEVLQGCSSPAKLRRQSRHRLSEACKVVHDPNLDQLVALEGLAPPELYLRI